MVTLFEKERKMELTSKAKGLIPKTSEFYKRRQEEEYEAISRYMRIIHILFVDIVKGLFNNLYVISYLG